MKENDLRTRLVAYLALREALGIPTRASRLLLQDFVASLEKHSDGKPIRAQRRSVAICEIFYAKGDKNVSLAYAPDEPASLYASC